MKYTITFVHGGGWSGIAACLTKEDLEAWARSQFGHGYTLVVEPL